MRLSSARVALYTACWCRGHRTTLGFTTGYSSQRQFAPRRLASSRRSDAGAGDVIAVVAGSVGGGSSALTALLAEALESGGTDGVSEAVLALRCSGVDGDDASTPGAPGPLALDVLTAEDWAQAVAGAAGGSRGRASSCFNAVLSCLGQALTGHPPAGAAAAPLGGLSASPVAGSFSGSGAGGAMRRADVARSLLGAMERPGAPGGDGRPLCAPDVVAFSACACACLAAGDEAGAAAVLRRARAAGSGGRKAKKARHRKPTPQQHGRNKALAAALEVPTPLLLLFRLRSRPAFAAAPRVSLFVPSLDFLFSRCAQVVFEDSSVVVVNKPSGLLVHRAEGSPKVQHQRPRQASGLPPCAAAFARLLPALSWAGCGSLMAKARAVGAAFAAAPFFFFLLRRAQTTHTAPALPPPSLLCAA